MKTKFITTLLLLIYSLLKAQCSIKAYESEGEKIIESNTEEFYRNIGENNNGDYSIGFLIAAGRLYSIGNEKNKWGLQIATSTRGKYKKIIPREIKFVFENEKTLIFKSTTYNRQNMLEICNYEMTKNESLNFINPIKSIHIMDNRTGQTENVTPKYKYIFTEQYECIIKY